MQLQVETQIYKKNGVGRDINAAQTTANNALSNSQAKYAISDTSSSTGAKIATLNPPFSNWQLFNGAEIFVKFDNSAYIGDETTTLTLTLKSSSADTNAVAYPIKDLEGNDLIKAFYWDSHATVHFMYVDNTWRILDIVSASKYNSLVTTIDEFSSTIGEQTSEISGDLNSLASRVSTNETNISENARNINLKANAADVYTQTDVNGLIQGEVNARNAAIQESANGITQTVGEVRSSLETQILGTYAISTSAANVINKTATIIPAIEDWSPVNGTTVTVSFVYANTQANPTLNINDTGEIPIRVIDSNGSISSLAQDEYLWEDQSTFDFTYNGTYWIMQDSRTSARLNHAETQIQQTANNVLIKATRTGATDAEKSAAGQSVIQSLINVAPEGVQISADKVNIEGAAIFSSGGRLSGDNVVSDVTIEYGVGSSPTSHIDIDEKQEGTSGAWSPLTPTWTTGSYVWQKTTKQKYTYNVSTQTWVLTPVVTYACIQGARGEGGSSIVVSDIEYAVSSTEAQPPDSAFDGNRTIPSVNEGQWLWTRTTYSDNNKLYTKSKQGVSGRSVNSVEEHYASSNDPAIEPAESESQQWGTTVINPSENNKYIWNYEIIKDSQGDEISRTNKRIVAVFGADGDEGRGIVDIINYYARSTLATPPEGDHDSNPNVWKTTPETLDSTNKYMWNYEVVTYTEGEPSTTSKRIIAIYGDTGDSAYTVILTNENHTFVGDTQHALDNQSTTCNVIGYKGSTQVTTSIGTITGNPSGMTISKSGDNTTSNSFTVAVNNAMESTHGVLNVPVTIDGKIFNMKFTYALALAGTNGAPAVTYSLVCNPASLVRTQSGLSPASITFSATRTEGQSSPVSYTGRIKIEEYNGTSWIEKSSTDTNNISYSPTNTAKLVRATLYLVGGTTTQLDIQTVPIVKDGSTVTATYDSARGVTTLTITNADGSSTTTEIKDGGEGAEWFFGTNEITHTTGDATATITGAKVGSMYLDTTTCNVYKCTDVTNNTQTWTYIMCLAAENTIAKVEPIYTRTNSATAPTNAQLPNIIITNTSDTGRTLPASSGAGWTLTHESRIAPPPGTEETSAQIITRLSWKYLWTCNQLIGTDGLLKGHTAIVADNGTTVIDGADITTGTITAEQIAAHSITANEITTDNIISTNGYNYINLANGTFEYKDTNSWSTANSGIQWTGSDLNIKGNITATSLSLGTGVKIPASTGISGLSTVATTGDYSDLTSTPDLTVYIAKDGVIGTEPSDSAASTTTGFKVSLAGLLKAANAVITGKIFATSGTIGGWNIGTDGHKSLYAYTNSTTTQNPVPGTSGLLLLSPQSSNTNSAAIAGSGTGLKWFISAGNVFGVTDGGALYSTSGNIGGWTIDKDNLKSTSGTVGLKGSGSTSTDVVFWAGNATSTSAPFKVTRAGALTATSGTIGGCSINNGVLEIAAANIKSGTIDSARIPNLAIDKITNLSTELTTAGNTANSYIYYTASTGLILAGTNPSSATTNYVKLKAPGTGVTDAGVTIVGNNANYKTTINSDGMQIYAGDTTNPVSTFGTEITIGKKESNQLYTTISAEDFIVTSDNTIQAIRVSPGVDTIKEDFYLFDQPLPPRATGTTRRTLANSIVDSITSGTSAYFMLENGNQRSRGTINLQTSGTTTRTITGTYAMTATLQVTRGTAYTTFTLQWSRTGTYEGPRVLVYFNASIVKPRLSFEGRSYFADSLYDSKRVYTNYDSSDGRGSLWLGRGYDEGDWTDNLGVFDSEASWLIRSDGTNVYSNMIYNASASTKAANVRVWVQDGDHGKLTQSGGSSKRFKKNIEDIENVEALYSIPVRQFKYREDYLDSKDQRFDQIIPGLIAEELEEIYPICVDKNVDNQPEDWNVRYLVPPMLKLIQNQKQEIEELKARIEVLEEK